VCLPSADILDDYREHAAEADFVIAQPWSGRYLLPVTTLYVTLRLEELPTVSMAVTVNV
jgi:hypothetical protein